LSKITLNFLRFVALPNFKGEPSKSCTQIITPASQQVVWKSFVMLLPLAAKF